MESLHLLAHMHWDCEPECSIEGAPASWSAPVLWRFWVVHSDRKRQGTGALQDLAASRRFMVVMLSVCSVGKGREFAVGIEHVFHGLFDFVSWFDAAPETNFSSQGQSTQSERTQSLL